MSFLRNNFKKNYILILIVLFVVFNNSILLVEAAEDINFNSDATQLDATRSDQECFKVQLSRIESFINNKKYDFAEELLLDLLALETLTASERVQLEQLQSDLDKVKLASEEKITIENIDSDSVLTEHSEEELESQALKNSESPVLFSAKSISNEMSAAEQVAADELYNNLMSNRSVSGRWNLAQEFKAKFPHDSRLQKVIDFAVTSNLNYAQNKHKAGDYSTAIYYYERVLGELPLGTPQAEVIERNVTLANEQQMPIVADDLYNSLMSSKSVSDRWNFAQEFKAKFPYDSRLQKVIDFAVNSNLNYAINKHKAGDYGTAIYYYERVLGELSANTPKKEVIEKNVNLAASKKKLITADDLYNRLMSSNSVSGRWNLAKEFIAKFPHDSRSKKAMDFALNSNLNYAINKHKAGDYKTAIGYYNRVLTELNNDPTTYKLVTENISRAQSNQTPKLPSVPFNGVTNSVVNVRSSPNGKSVGQLPIYSAIKGQLNGDWIQMTYRGTTGYIPKSSVTKNDSSIIHTSAYNSVKNILSTLPSSGYATFYYQDLTSGDYFSINNKRLYPQSTIKVFVMAAMYDEIAKGNIRETAVIRNEISDMITWSSNTAYNSLIIRLGRGNFSRGCGIVNKFLINNGYRDTRVKHSLHPSAHNYMHNNESGYNYSTARDLGQFMSDIHSGRLVSQSFSKKMVDLLTKTPHNENFGNGIPKDIKYAHKSGSAPAGNRYYTGDAGIVYKPSKPFVLSMLLEMNTSNMYTHSRPYTDVAKILYYAK